MFTGMSNDCPYVHDKLIKLLLSKTECETVPWKNILYSSAMLLLTIDQYNILGELSYYYPWKS